MSNIKKTLNLQLLIKALEGGTKLISIEQNHINDLNVFPVPDGDTGSNMNSTIANGFDTLKSTKIETFKQLAKIYSQGLLMNARGNSGVIFSQIMKGFTNGLLNVGEELTTNDMIICFQNAKEKAYSSVAKPVEGTILTVIRLTADALLEKNDFENMNELFEFAYQKAYEALQKTPEMLEALKTVGVVDSGGYGLMTFIKGMNAAIQENLETIIVETKNDLANIKSVDKADFSSFVEHAESEGFGYCSEIILKLGDKIDPESKSKSVFEKAKFESFLKKIGNSIVFVQDDDLVKVHVHTLTPYKLLMEAQKYGEFVKIKIENMNNQFYNEAKKQGININKIDVSELQDKSEIVITLPSYRLAKRFKEDFDINHIIVTEDDGNPSIQTILSKVYDTKAKRVVVIVDDSNVILAVKQVAKLVSKKIKVEVIATNNAYETSLAILNYERDIDFKSAIKSVKNALKSSISGLISKSIKDVDFKNIKVNKDDYIGITKKQIIVDNPNRIECVKELIGKLIEEYKINDPDQCICHLIYGKTISEEETLKLDKVITEQYGIVCSIECGDQPSYDYIVGIERF